jgi:hypothetical protein
MAAANSRAKWVIKIAAMSLKWKVLFSFPMNSKRFKINIVPATTAITPTTIK